MRRRVRLTTLAVSALALAGCSGDDVFDLEVGDCFDSAELGEYVEQVPVVPCEEEHDAEVFASTQLTGDEFPGDEALFDEAWTYCEQAFTEFVGLAYEESALDMFPMYPVEEGWDDLGDREVLCIVSDLNRVTGSLAGVAR